jgi:DNA polymerase sigma
VFGSFSTGLCLQHSDVDLAVIDAPPLENLPITQASSILVRKLAAALSAYEWCESINPLDTASMPVLKCLCRPFATANAPSIAVDITIGSINRVPPAVQEPRKFSSRHTGGAARDYVLQKIREFPALAPLVW